jgi:DNA-binding NtrC family response regulator
MKLKNRQILLVDDDAWIRDAMSLYLSNEGCRVVTAESAEEGLAILKENQFDVLVCDYQLPDQDGLFFFEAARRMGVRVPMILITAYGSKQLYAAAECIGVDIFIDKPFNAYTIEHAIIQLLKNEALVPCKKEAGNAREKLD